MLAVSKILLVMTITMYVTAQKPHNTTDIHQHRRLQARGSLLFMNKKKSDKAARMKRILSVIDKTSPVVGNKLKPEPWGAQQHNPSENAIFAVCMNVETEISTVGRKDALQFLGSLRGSRYKGDIVLGISTGYRDSFLDAVKEHNVIVYAVPIECGVDKTVKQACNYPGRPDIRASVNMIRFYLYQYWASLYKESSLLMVSDFRDVIFQSDPFKYRRQEWQPPAFQLAVFLEAYPNKGSILECVYNRQWIESCYGQKALHRIGTNTVSCSGVTMGTRNAMLVYTYLLTQQLDPMVRYPQDKGKGKEEESESGMSEKGYIKNKETGCLSMGMDQGFHNHLIYSGVLDWYMDVKVFSQGQGPVNNIGAFYPGMNAMLKLNLTEWKVLRSEGEGGDMNVYNWNGDISPVVHQYDRFEGLDLQPAAKHHLKVLKKLKW